MRILLAQNMIYAPTLGGANKANRALLEGLAARGHACRAVAPMLGSHGPRNAEEFHAEMRRQGIRVASRSSGVWTLEAKGVEVCVAENGARIHALLDEQMREFRPDCTLVSSEDPGQELLRSTLDAQIGAVIYLVFSPIYLPFGTHSYLPSEARTETVRRADGILTISRFVQSYIREASGLDSKVLPLPIFSEGPFESLACFDEGFVTIVNPCAYKGISIFFELTRRLPEVAFAAVPTWGTTEAERSALEARPNVRLLPPADRIETILARTRVLLMPSLWIEAFGFLSVEAMLRGIPVLASDAGGLPEAKLGVDYVLPVRMIERYEKRFDERHWPVGIVPEQDARPWEAVLRRVLGDRTHYERLSRESRDAALAFHESMKCDDYEDYFQGIVSRNQTQEKFTSAAAQSDRFLKGNLHDAVARLSPEKRALLMQKLKKKTRLAEME